MKLMKLYLTLMLLLTHTMGSTKNNVTLNELLGQFNEKTHPEFINLDSTSLPVNKSGMYLRKIVAEKLVQAYHDFKHKHPDIPFIIVSATRNYDYQNSIWQYKWQNLYPKYLNSKKTVNEILNYSAMPGTSRHHWGTDVDITNVDPDYFRLNPKGKILFSWLKKNMPKYGFCHVYTKGRNRGYKPEEWHWSYKPLSKYYLAKYQYYIDKKPDEIINNLTFAGHDKINLKDIIKEYVFSINKACY